MAGFDRGVTLPGFWDCQHDWQNGSDLRSPSFLYLPGFLHIGIIGTADRLDTRFSSLELRLPGLVAGLRLVVVECENQWNVLGLSHLDALFDCGSDRTFMDAFIESHQKILP